MEVGVGSLLVCGVKSLCGVLGGSVLADGVWLLVDSKMAKPSRSKFIIFVSVEGLESFGADTPISLLATERQAAFKEITNQRLKRILLDSDPLVLVAIKMVLGKSHLERKKYAQDNAYISSRFLAMLLDVEVSKVEAKELLVRLFREDLLGVLEETLKAAFVGKGIPRSSDLELLWKTDEAVKIFPFLLDLKGAKLMHHRMVSAMAMEFLKRKLGLVVEEGLDWVVDFDTFAKLNGFL